MSKHVLNLGLLLLLASGCKLGAYDRESGQNVNAAQPANAVADHPQNAKSFSADSPVTRQSAPQPQPATGAACPDPDKPCQHREKRFDDWELSFRLPAKLKANTPYKSAPFHAVILKTYPMDEDCDGGEFIEAAESDRKREQNNQLERKVFASYECPNMAAVIYDFEDGTDARGESVEIGNFIAIYAGETPAAAEETLRFMKSEYSQTVLKQMTTVYEKIEP